MSHENTSSTRTPINRDEVAARTFPILAEEAGMAVEDLRDSQSLSDDLMYDSLQTVEVVMELEEEFDLNIDDEDAQKMRTVGDVVDGLCTLLDAGSRGS